MNKKRDERIWTRMGRELAALRDLMGHICTDPEYNAVLPCKVLGKMCTAQDHIDKLRSEAENRMAQFIPGWDTDTFYPHDRRDLEAAIEEFRDRMKEARQ